MRNTIVMVAVLLVGCASTEATRPADEGDLASLIASLDPNRKAPKVDAAKIAKYPLGTAENPVRVNGPGGERQYLGRLICPDGRPPTFERAGSTGLSPYGYIMDIYRVACDTIPIVSVYMDMYHGKYVELQPLPGFTIEPPTGP